MMNHTLKGAALAGAAALTMLASPAMAQQAMDCGLLSFNSDGTPGVTGTARLERGVSASPGIEGRLIIPGEASEAVTGAWEAGAAVLFLGDGEETVNAREYSTPTGSPAYILAGRAGARPVFFFCDPAPEDGRSPPRPEPEPDPRPEPGAESFIGTVDMGPGQFADLDRPAVLSAFSTDADLAMVDEASGTMIFPVGGAVRLGDPFGFSSMALQERCENARERGRLESSPIPEVTLRRGEEVCFETGEGGFGAFEVRSINPRQAVFDVFLFD